MADNILPMFEAVIIEYLGMSSTDHLDLSLPVDQVMDSLELVKVVLELEATFDIRIPDRTIAGFKTIGDMFHYVCTQVVME